MIGPIVRAAAAWLLLAVASPVGALAADPLARLPIDPGQVSVAGISSGAFMANQLHIAHSAGIMGAGIVAGGPYGCAVDRMAGDGVAALASLAVGPCMSVPSLLRPVDSYARLVADLAARGWIDPPQNIVRSRLYFFAGKADKIVAPQSVELGASLYRTLGVPASQITFRDRDLPGAGAGHSWVTKNFGSACDANASPFINNCGYDQAGEMLQTIYGQLQGAADRPGGRIIAFDQTEFVPRAATAANGLSDSGYLYVPKDCEAGAAQLCRLAVTLHGCLQSAEVLGNEFYTRIGINEWADTNRIVVLYPQAHATSVSELAMQNASSTFNTNPNGCWNWWGYANDAQFLTKQGMQIGAIWSMVRRLTGQGN
ncbi:extracellular catalytic domain type 2 short-chain-length polyhydroxyalkanoate depolymerase [Reyranella soli]|uniref:Depolymerase n=1 Tax=Reyranella soli TaxID=1230389 RepID=A0A512NKG6_9HYPH|nr:depolymerase [Reyranella soli]GEP59448.1 depolymerase [Reyranella soli]